MKLKLSLLSLLLPFALSCGSDGDETETPNLSAGSAYTTAFFAQFDQGCDCGFDDFCSGPIRDAAEASVRGADDCLNAAAEADPAVTTQLACFAEHFNNCGNASCDDFVDCSIELPDCGTQEQAITDCLATSVE